MGTVCPDDGVCPTGSDLVLPVDSCLTLEDGEGGGKLAVGLSNGRHPRGQRILEKIKILFLNQDYDLRFHDVMS